LRSAARDLDLSAFLPLECSLSALAQTASEWRFTYMLTFLSDGVVEARSGRRELFGFESTRQMSTLSAQQQVEAARLFGQEDDIAVLTLTCCRGR